MSTPSPGPWGVNPQRPSEVRVLVDGQATGQLVADTSTVNVRVPWRENAVLIAAAPELLAALEKTVETLGYPESSKPVMEQALAAITKAKGSL